MNGMQVRDWYVESFKELRNFKPIRDAESELKFTGLLRHIYHRHRFDFIGPQNIICGQNMPGQTIKRLFNGKRLCLRSPKTL